MTQLIIDKLDMTFICEVMSVKVINWQVIKNTYDKIHL